MEDIRLVIDLLIALGAALLCGAVAQRIGLPVIIGYIAAGLVIGPNTPGFVADRHQVELLANVGVAFLMFALGVEFSIHELMRVRRVALVTGGLQIPLTILLSAVVGRAIGWSWEASLLLGGAFAISSSIVAIKVLMSRGEMQSPHGAIAVGTSVVQDLSLVVMLSLAPALTSDGDDIVVTLLRSIAIAVVALAGVIFVGTRVVPVVLGRIANTGSRELFLLTVVVIALGTATLAHEAGLSFALGAFLAGMVVSESEYDAQVAAQIAPLRDLFATLFFVAVGMLLEPSVIADDLGTALLLIATLVFGKMLITGGALLASGVDHWTATRAAIVLAQMGEFSFVLAGVGFAEEIIGDDQYGLILTAAIGSIFLMPILLAGAPTMTSIALRMPFVEFREGRWITPIGKEVYDTGHVVICGYGRIGSELARSLDAQNIHYAVVDINPAMVRLLRERGTWSAFGDATEEHILRTLGIARAKTVAITIPDMVGARSIIRLAREINPGIAVIARAMNANQVESISDQGANEVVQPEFEAAMEFARQVLTWHGIEEDVAIADIIQRRAQVYRLAIDVAEPPASARAVQVDDRVTLVG
jgi:CPA2 family monovalent cation:H+ antiporter-2